MSLSPTLLPGLALWALLSAPAQEPAAPPASRPEPAADRAGLRATQVTIRLGRKQFQATVVAKSSSAVTLLTAAHCIAPDEVGAIVVVSQGTASLVGKIVSATPNPDYRPISSRDPQSRGVRGVLGVDSAVALIEITVRTPAEAQILRAIEPVDLAAAPVLGASGRRTITVHIVDQHGASHAVKAGNHLNPKCLAWGNSSFRPLPGDSGAGVFLVRETADGKALPVLIGNVALSDDRGGIAPLISRRSAWLDRAAFHGEPEPEAEAEASPDR